MDVHLTPWYGTPSKSFVSLLQLRLPTTSFQAIKAATTFNDVRASLAEWDANQLRGQLGPADDRLRASTALERKASASSTQQATSLAALEVCSSPAIGIMMIASDSLCARIIRVNSSVHGQHDCQCQRRR